MLQELLQSEEKGTSRRKANCGVGAEFATAGSDSPEWLNCSSHTHVHQEITEMSFDFFCFLPASRSLLLPCAPHEELRAWGMSRAVYVLLGVLAFLLSAFCLGEMFLLLLIADSVKRTGNFHGLPFQLARTFYGAVGSFAVALLFSWMGVKVVRKAIQTS
jgi:hypothetical protein